MKITFKEFYTNKHLAILSMSKTYSIILHFHTTQEFNTMFSMLSEEKRVMEAILSICLLFLQVLEPLLSVNCH